MGHFKLMAALGAVGVNLRIFNKVAVDTTGIKASPGLVTVTLPNAVRTLGSIGLQVNPLVARQMQSVDSDNLFHSE